MAKQRDKVRMTDDEVDDFLWASKTLIVSSLDRDGAPHLTALWFAHHEGTILFETYGSSQKVVNLRRDPRVAVLCEAGETYDQLRGVSIQGKAEIVDGGPRLADLMMVVISRNTPGLDPAALAGHVEAMIRKRVIVAIHPEKVISWDHRKLGLG
jgi:PPOX class probable F420-dependent enzyme